jgi:hypothetical protein
VEAIDAHGKTVFGSSDSTLQLPVRNGESYLLKRPGVAAQSFAAITGTPATQYKKLGPVQIGK